LKQYSELRARVTKLIEKYEKIQIVKNKTKPTHEKPVANGTKHEVKMILKVHLFIILFHLTILSQAQ
jgi:hypothetical protein